jgi:tRNA threonylcarbamoyl adenosine modification protein YeaZ
MKSLILETSTEASLLAITENDRILWEKHLSGGPELSKTLGLEIKKMLELCPPPFDRIVIGAGPGSYTGIRVGAAMAQALSFGWQIPLYTVCSLTAFAPNSDENFAIAIDARSGGFFIQENFSPPKLLKLDEAIKVLHTAALISSPHPEKLLARIPSLTNLIKAAPNPLQLARHSIAADKPDLSYLSTPGNFS